MSSPKLIYFGTPHFSAEILESLITNLSKQIDIIGIVTQPDVQIGRKKIITESDVAKIGTKYDLPVFKPKRLDQDNLSHIKLLKPDIFLVVSYGKIIPQDYLLTPTLGTFNIHFSLLPKYRGALCISEAIKNQDKVTGVTFMRMTTGLDAGPIIIRKETKIDIDDDCQTLTKKLTREAISLLLEYLPKISGKNLTETSQDESQATYTPFTKTRTHATAYIPWDEIKSCLSNEQHTISNEQCLRLHALIRSLNPDPGAWTTINGQDLKIIKTSLIDNKLEIQTIQLSGKNPISWSTYLSGHKID